VPKRVRMNRPGAGHPEDTRTGHSGNAGPPPAPRPGRPSAGRSGRLAAFGIAKMKNGIAGLKYGIAGSKYGIAGLKYGIVGLIGTALHTALLVLLVESVRMHPVPASAAGFLAALAASFILNRRWTFGVRRPGRHAFFKYTAVSVAGLALNGGIMFAAVEWLRLEYWIGQLVAVLVVPPVNFALNAAWTFRG